MKRPWEEDSEQSGTLRSRELRDLILKSIELKLEGTDFLLSELIPSKLWKHILFRGAPCIDTELSHARHVQCSYSNCSKCFLDSSSEFILVLIYYLCSQGKIQKEQNRDKDTLCSLGSKGHIHIY
jgi:hypothetical protein